MAARIARTRTNSKRRARNLPNLASRLFGTPLLIDERKLDAIVPVFLRKINGEPDEETNPDDARETLEMSIDPQSGIAVIPVIGSIVRRQTWLDAWSGLTSYSEIAENLESALNDARVKAILFQIDSFGGEAAGCFELCDKIYKARSLKKIWGIADVDALSAGFGILSSCERVYATSRGSVASIGVISVHVERSQQNEMMGVTYTVFRAGERKGDFNPFEKLSTDAAIKLQSSIERTRQTFAETIARNRPGVTVQAALDTEGQWYDPEDAFPIGLIDGISTYEDAFSELLATIVTPVISIKAPEEPLMPVDNPDQPEDLPSSEKGNAMDPKDAPTTAAAPPAAAAETPPATPTPPAPPIAATAPVAPATPPATGAVVSLDDARQPAETRAIEIAGLCKLAGFPEQAPDYIANTDLSVADVRTKLQTMRAEKDAGIGNLSGFHAGGPGGAMPAAGFVSRPNSQALASWGDHFKAAQATNPKFAATATRR